MGEITNERLDELMRYHKERAIYFEQMSDNMRHMETYKESLPHWDVYEALRELRSLRRRDYVLVPREPTKVMLNAIPLVESDRATISIGPKAGTEIYRAMLAAAEQTGRPDTGGLPHVGPSDSQ